MPRSCSSLHRRMERPAPEAPADARVRPRPRRTRFACPRIAGRGRAAYGDCGTGGFRRQHRQHDVHRRTGTATTPGPADRRPSGLQRRCPARRLLIAGSLGLRHVWTTPSARRGAAVARRAAGARFCARSGAQGGPSEPGFTSCLRRGCADGLTAFPPPADMAVRGRAQPQRARLLPRRLAGVLHGDQRPPGDVRGGDGARLPRIGNAADDGLRDRHRLSSTALPGRQRLGRAHRTVAGAQHRPRDTRVAGRGHGGADRAASNATMLPILVCFGAT